MNRKYGLCLTAMVSGDCQFMSLDAVNSVLGAQKTAVDTQIHFALAKKQLDTVQQQGDAVNQLLQSAVQLSKAAGRGDGFDAVG